MVVLEVVYESEVYDDVVVAPGPGGGVEVCCGDV